VSGRGQIIAVDNTAVSIALQAGGPAEVRIEIGPVFGNAVRDGSGLLNVSDFANAQEFNALSAEINRRVEEQVLPLLQGQAVIGASIRFAGGVEVSDASGTPSVLALIPVVVEFP
jgi:predicted lipoprotein